MKKILLPPMFALFCLISFETSAQIALDFDGTDDKVDCGNPSSVQITGTAITLEAWIYPTQWKTNAFDGNVICKEDNNSNSGYMLRVGGSGQLNFALGDGSKAWSEKTSTSLLSLNKWQHIAGTYDGSMMRMYINGSLVDSLKVSISIANAGVNLLLGAHTTFSRYYQGKMDEVRIWNICRTVSQLNAAMYDEFCSPQKNLKLYYKFNQGKPGASNTNNKKVNDLSGNSATGTLTQFALKGSTSNWVTGVSLNKGISYGADSAVRCDYLFSPSGKYKWVTSGVYYDTLFTTMECDSAVKFKVTIKKSTSSTITAHACDSYKSPSGLYTWTKSGTYVDYLRNSVNCDSQITVYLTVGGSYDTIYPETCYSYTSPSGKYVWTQSGVYADTIPNYRKCDSIISVSLTIFNATTATVNAKACSAYKVSGTKHTYTQSGVYKDTLVNYHGCDSIITTNLNILHSAATISPVVCKTYTSPSGKHVWTQSGQYFDTIKNYAFCDSALTINLTILKSTTASITPVSCGDYTSPSGKVYKNSAKFNDIIKNQAGCDSVIDVDLTVVRIDKAVTLANHTLSASEIGAQYQWLNCKDYSAVNNATQRVFTPDVDGSYAVEITRSVCVDTSKCTAVNGLLLDNIATVKPIKVFPNPSNGSFKIEISKPDNNGIIQVSDIAGRIVFESRQVGQNTIDVNLKDASGIFTVIYTSGDNVWKTPVVINR